MFQVRRGATSRTTRDDGANVEVCSRCGDRESLYGYDAAAQVPFTEWPLSPEQLADEELRLIRGYQNAEMTVATVTPEDAERWLAPDDPDDDEPETP